MRHEERPLLIKSDSKYVVNGCCSLRFAWAALGWHKVHNADLWKELHALLEDRGRESVKVSKVKGHASRRDIRTGKVKLQDKIGNDAADRLATAGAAAHSLPQSRVRAVKLRAAVAEDVQRLMVDIIAARGVHPQRLHAAAPSTARVDWRSQRHGTLDSDDSVPVVDSSTCSRESHCSVVSSSFPSLASFGTAEARQQVPGGAVRRFRLGSAQREQREQHEFGQVSVCSSPSSGVALVSLFSGSNHPT